jgi:hypothetical protein
MTPFTLRRESCPEEPFVRAGNKGKAVLPLTSQLCKFVTIVKGEANAELIDM